MAKPAPNAKDVQDFQFKLHAKLRVFHNTGEPAFDKPCNLIAAASRFGLVFIGSSENALIVTTSQTIETLTLKDGEAKDFPCREIPLPSRVLWLSVNCDCTVLAVIFQKDDCPWCLFYDVQSFWKSQTRVINEVRLSIDASVYVLEINWNPSIPSMFTACKSNGALSCYELKETGLEINEIPAEAKNTCFCWSPKGKQIAVGSLNGTITQYKPDLKAVKVINAPPLEDNPAIISLHWISNYQFVGVYKSSTNPETGASLIVVDAPKTGDVSFTNFDDVCCSNPSGYLRQFYLNLISPWSTLMVASAASTEVAILGMERDSWVQWSLGDAARAELPLSVARQDTLPVGLHFDTAYTQPIPWGESTIPPFPMLLLISDEGLLMCFRALNLKADTPSICHAPESLPDRSGAAHFVKRTEQPTASAPPAFTFAQPAAAVEEVKAPPILFPPPKTTAQPLFPAPPPTTHQFPIKPVVVEPAKAPVLEVPPSPATPPMTFTEDLQREADVQIAYLIREECDTLEAEVNVLLQSARALKIDLGADEEAVELVHGVDSVQKTLQDVTDAMSTLANGVHGLKQNLIQTWAWFEDARSRYVQSQDPVVKVLRKNQPLDPVSQSYATNIDHMLYYIESQSKQARDVLDEQWEQFQNQFKSSMKYKVPNIEAIYHTMIRHQAILQKQRYLLKDISNRIKSCRSKSGGASLLVVLDKADSLERELRRLCLQPNLVNVQYEKLLLDQKKFTPKKQAMLKCLLKQTPLAVVHVNKPQLSTDYLQTIRTPSSTPKSLPVQKSSIAQEPFTSLLGAAMSPIVTSKPLVARNLDFVQSTPKPDTIDTHKGVLGTNKLTTAFSAPNVTVTAIPFTTAPTSSAFVPTVNFSVARTAAVCEVAARGSTFSFGTITPMTTTPAISSTTGVQFGSAVTTGVMPSFNTAAVNALFDGTANVAPNFKVFAPPTKTTASATFLPPETTTTTSTIASKSLFTTVTATTALAKSTSAPTFFAKAPTTSVTPQVAANRTQSTATILPISSAFTSPATMQLNKIELPASLTVTPVVPPKSAEGQSSLFSTGKALLESAMVSAPTKPVTSVEVATPSSSKGISGFSFAQAGSTKSPMAANTTLVIPQVKSPVEIKAVDSSTDVHTSQTTDTTITAEMVKSTTGTTTAAAPSVNPSTAASFGASKSPSFGSMAPTPASSNSTLFDFNTGTVSSSTSLNTSSTAVTTTTTATTKLSDGPSTTTTAAAAPTTPGSIFGFAAQSSIFGQKSGAPVAGVTNATTTSVFGAPQSTTSIFGTNTDASVFGGAATSAPLFGGASTAEAASSAFGAPTGKAAPTFCAPATTAATLATPTTAAQAFGAAASPAFGTAAAAVATTTTTTTTTTATAAPFGAPATTAPAFGAAVVTSPPTFATPVFGTAQATPPFGATLSPAATTPTASVFGTPTTAGNLFGATNPTTTTTASVFGAPTTNAQSIFGGAATAFGQSQPTGAFGSTAVFGQTTTANVFGGAAAAFGATNAGAFGGGGGGGGGAAFGATPTSTFGASPSVFSSPVSAAPFGAPPPNSNASTFGGSFSFASAAAPKTTTAGFGGNSGFGFGGGGTSTNNAFSFGNLNVGTTAPAAFGSTFGQAAPQQSQNPFAKAAETKPAFGGGNVFGAPAASSTSVFGGGSSAGNVFGGGTNQGFGNATSTFGAPSTFGQSTFGQPNAFGGGQSGPFSGGSGSVAQSGFGAFGQQQTPQKPGGFGSPAAFGSTSPGAFGAAPAFGGSPTFGTNTFGGQAKLFGSPTQQNAFGNAPNSAQNSTFANLATQSTLGFGALAQQTPPQQSQQPTFSGSSSFSTWR